MAVDSGTVKINGLRTFAAAVGPSTVEKWCHKKVRTCMGRDGLEAHGSTHPKRFFPHRSHNVLNG